MKKEKKLTSNRRKIRLRRKEKKDKHVYLKELKIS